MVILDKDDYKKKVKDILSDCSKFTPVNEPIQKVLLQVEDKVNRLLTKLKKCAAISHGTYIDLFVSGSTPGILYGLPKVHKLLTPLRPIFAACGTPTYKLAKFLVPLLSPLTENQYTVKNSSQFVSDLRNVRLGSNSVLASFDIESLFTNIPVRETIDICISSLFAGRDTFSGIAKGIFRSMLELSVLNSYFLFDGVLFQQRDGVGMGLPLGPTFANIFLCYYEKIWLDKCPTTFKPKYYRRYVDDCFLIFDDHSQDRQFPSVLKWVPPKDSFYK